MVIQENCIGCKACIPYCPVGAIVLITTDEKKKIAKINEDECVECGVCFRANVCKTGALQKTKLEWPRLVRAAFSDPVFEHPDTKGRGRGTAEMKTNDVRGKFKTGEAGIGLELGRPGIGTRFSEVEKVYKALLDFGVEFEEENPINSLIENPNTGDFKKEILNEKALSGIIEFKVPNKKLPAVLDRIKVLSADLNTVFSFSLITNVSRDSEKAYEIAESLGYKIHINAKVNIGLGRPLVIN